MIKRRVRAAWQDVALVASREISSRLRQKGFVIGSLAGIVVVVAIAALPGLLKRDRVPNYTVAVSGQDGAALAAAIEDAARHAPAAVRVRVTEHVSAGAARAEVRSGRADAAIADGGAIVESALAPKLAVVLDAALRMHAVDKAVTSGALKRSDAGALATSGLQRVETIHPSDSASSRRKTLGYAGVVLLYGLILTYGIWVAVGLVEEKASRVIEVVLSTVEPRRFLAGKIFGIGALAITQFVAMSAAGLVAAAAAGSIRLPPGWPLTFAIVTAWFVLGFGFYGCGYAVTGSLVSRQEELQGVQLPMTLAAVVAFFAASAALERPGGGLAVATTFLPPTAPFVAPLRMAAGACPWWQALGGLAATAVGCAAMVVLAARVYAGTALRTRGRTKLLAAWRGGS